MRVMALAANEDFGIYPKWQKKMFLHEEFSDCAIWVKTSNSCTRFPCHRAILAASSKVFADILSTTTHEKCSSIIIEDLNPNVVIVILKYIYFGHIELKGCRLVCDVLKAAIKYKMVQLIHHCEDYLEEKLTLQNVCHIFEAAILNNSLKLKEISKSLCREAGFVILNTSSLQEVNLETLKMILSITDLQIQSEMAAFKAAWDWAAYQCCKETILVSDENIVNKMSPLLEFIVFEFMSSEEIDSLPAVAVGKFHEMFPQRMLGCKKEVFGVGFNCKRYDRSITEFEECDTDVGEAEGSVGDTEKAEECVTNIEQSEGRIAHVDNLEKAEECVTDTEKAEKCITNIEQYEGKIAHADILEKQNCDTLDKTETSQCLPFPLIKQRKVTFPLQLTNYCKNFKAPVFLYRDISLKGNIILFRFSVNANVYLKDLSIIHYSDAILRKPLVSLHIYNKNGILASFSVKKEGNMKMIAEKNLYHGEIFNFHTLDLVLVKAQNEYTVEVNRSSGECDVTWPGTLMEKMRVDDVEISILSHRCYGLCHISFIEAS